MGKKELFYLLISTYWKFLNNLNLLMNKISQSQPVLKNLVELNFGVWNENCQTLLEIRFVYANIIVRSERLKALNFF